MATDLDVFKLPAENSAMHAVFALFHQHSGQPAEAITLARRAEEGRNQHMGAYDENLAQNTCYQIPICNTEEGL